MTQPEHSSAMGLRWLLFWCFRLPGDGMRRELQGIAQFNPLRLNWDRSVGWLERPRGDTTLGNCMRRVMPARVDLDDGRCAGVLCGNASFVSTSAME